MMRQNALVSVSLFTAVLAILLVFIMGRFVGGLHERIHLRVLNETATAMASALAQKVPRSGNIAGVLSPTVASYQEVVPELAALSLWDQRGRRVFAWDGAPADLRVLRFERRVALAPGGEGRVVMHFAKAHILLDALAGARFFIVSALAVGATTLVVCVMCTMWRFARRPMRLAAARLRALLSDPSKDVAPTRGDVVDLMRAVKAVERHHPRSGLSPSVPRNQASALFDAMPQAVLGVAKDGRIAVQNAAAGALWDAGKTGLVGHLLVDLLCPESRVKHRLALAPNAAHPDGTRGSYRAELDAITRHGRHIFVEMRCSASFVGDDKLRVYHFSDITAQKGIERALTAETDAARAALSAARAELSNALQRLRKPVQAIRETLAALSAIDVTSSQKKCWRRAARAADTLHDVERRIAHGLRDATKTFTSESFDVVEVTHAIAQGLAPSAHAKGIELSLFVDPRAQGRVHASATGLVQVLTHLLSNAIKFTSRGGVVLAVQPQTDALLFTVIDSGDGIDNDVLQRLADDGASSGVGLTVAKHWTNVMNGRFAYSTKVGQGTRIALRMPCELVAQPERFTALDGHKIGVLDTNAVSRRMLVQQIAAWGAQTSVIDVTAPSTFAGGTTAVVVNDPIRADYRAWSQADLNAIASTTDCVIVLQRHPKDDAQADGVCSLAKPPCPTLLYDRLASLITTHRGVADGRAGQDSTSEEDERARTVLVGSSLR